MNRQHERQGFWAWIKDFAGEILGDLLWWILTGALCVAFFIFKLFW